MRMVNPRFHRVSIAQISGNLHEKDMEVTKTLKEHHRHVSVVSVTTDCWSDEQANSYSLVTAHYITSDWNLHSHVLRCSRLPGRHTGKKLSKLLVRVFEEFQITKKVLCVSTDSASNVLSSVNLTAESFAILSEMDIIQSEHDPLSSRDEEKSGMSDALQFIDDVLDPPEGDNNTTKTAFLEQVILVNPS